MLSVQLPFFCRLMKVVDYKYDELSAAGKEMEEVVRKVR